MSDMKRLKNQVLARVFTMFPSLAERWGKRLEVNASAIPWAKPMKPLKDAVIALVTTGGVHLKTQKPFDMTDQHGDPSYREIPVDTPSDGLAITHDYYDHRDADRDVNLVLPVARFRELADHGAVGRLHNFSYSFMGHIDGPHVETLIRKTGPEVARKLANAKVDYALLVPA